MRLRTALLFQDGNFVGREYFRALAAAGRAPDLVAAAGRMGEESATREAARTGGRWNPPAIPAGIAVHRFEKANDPALAALLREERIDLAIQGGLAFLKDEVLSAPGLGFLNVHPGALPRYRGASCPEWQLYEGEPVVATAHLMDEGLDSGPVVHAAPMSIRAGWTYEDLRANLYAHCGRVLVAALERLERDGPGCARPQDEAAARRLPPIPPEKMDAVRARLATMAAV